MWGIIEEMHEIFHDPFIDGTEVKTQKRYGKGMLTTRKRSGKDEFILAFFRKVDYYIKWNNLGKDFTLSVKAQPVRRRQYEKSEFDRMAVPTGDLSGGAACSVYLAGHLAARPVSIRKLDRDPGGGRGNLLRR